MTTPICESCFTEMRQQGRCVTLGYQHNNAPVDYSKGYRYSCPGCDTAVYLPIGLGFGMATGEVRDCIPVQPNAPHKQGPQGKLP